MEPLKPIGCKYGKYIKELIHLTTCSYKGECSYKGTTVFKNGLPLCCDSLILGRVAHAAGIKCANPKCEMTISVDLSLFAHRHPSLNLKFFCCKCFEHLKHLLVIKYSPLYGQNLESSMNTEQMLNFEIEKIMR